MAAYFILQANIRDREAYARIVDEVIPMFGLYGAKILAANDNAKLLRGEPGYKRTVIVEFKDDSSLQAWFRDVQEVGLIERGREFIDTYMISAVDGIEPF